MDNQQTVPAVAIPLPKGKKNAVQIGCICMMLSVAMYGLVFATLTMPILESINAVEYVSLFSILTAVGISIMTPIGGKLGDLIGRRNIVVIPGIICAISGILFAFVHSLVPLMSLILIISLSQGAFTAAPYIIVGLINERKDVPKAMGMLATAIAVGGFGGSIIAGFLTDMGLLQVAILMPALPLILGIILIGMNMPNQKRSEKVVIDIPGIILLVLSLGCILLALNFGGYKGWTNPIIIAGIIVGIICLIALFKVESHANEPIIPVRLLTNKKYTTLLIVGFICYFYVSAMNYYAPIGAMRVMGTSTSVAGTLQMPRTLITIFLPTIVGVWLGKKSSNAWKAMAVATGVVALAMTVMGFTNPSMPIMVYFVSIAATGIAESYRSVSITSTAQAMLEPEDMGVGTALVNFANSLAGTVAAALFGVAYNAQTISNPEDALLIQNGVNSVFRLVAIVTAIGFVIVMFAVRPMLSKSEKTDR